MLAAGQRRMFNTHQIFRDPAWRRYDPDGALLINSADLGELGARDGDWIAIESPVGRLIHAARSTRASHGYGHSYPALDGDRFINGPTINLLAESGNRDPIAGTPDHKHVAVRLSLVPAHEAAACQMQSDCIHTSVARRSSAAAGYRRAVRPLLGGSDLRSRDRVFHPVICRSRPARAG